MVRVRWLVLALIWAAGIWYLSSIPDLNSGLPQDFILRKIAHATEFAVLTLLVHQAIRKSNITLAAAIALAYAAIDELHQSFVLGRTGSPLDVAIDGIGIVVAVLALIVVRRVAISRGQTARRP